MSSLTLTVSENMLVRAGFEVVGVGCVTVPEESSLGHFQYWTPENDDFASDVE